MHLSNLCVWYYVNVRTDSPKHESSYVNTAEVYKAPVNKTFRIDSFSDAYLSDIWNPTYLNWYFQVITQILSRMKLGKLFNIPIPLSASAKSLNYIYL